MSTKAVIVWLAIAVVLGLAAVLLLRQGPGGIGGGGGGGAKAAIGERVFEINPAEVQSITMSSGDVIAREGGGWVLRTKGMNGGGERSWPLVGTNVEGLFGRMGRLTSVSTVPEDASLGKEPTELRFDLTGGRVVTVRLAERTLGGTGLVEIVRGAEKNQPEVRRWAIVNDELHTMFRAPGARSWRDRSAMGSGSGVAALADVSRIRLSNSGTVLRLGKVANAWSVQEPVEGGAPADPAAVQRLLGVIADVQIADYLDSGIPAGASTGLERPAATVVLETDRREIAAEGTSGENVKTSVVRRTLNVGGPADSTGNRLFASIDEDAEGGGGRVVVVDARGLAALTTDPAAYIAVNPTRVAPADIGMIVVEDLPPAGDTPFGGGTVYKRTIDRWSRVNERDGSEEVLVEGALRGVEALVGFLTGTLKGAGGEANAPSIAVKPPEGYKPVARVQLLSLGGGPLESIEVGRGAPGMATLRTGSVYRTFAVNRVPGPLSSLLTPVPVGGAGADAMVPDGNK